MTAQAIRDLDHRVRQHMLVNHQLTREEVTAALETRDDLPDLAGQVVICSTVDPSEPDEEDDEEETEEEV